MIRLGDALIAAGCALVTAALVACIVGAVLGA